MSSENPSNDEIARVLDHIADLLETQRANPHRVRAYRNGAESVRNAPQSIAGLARENEGTGLQQLPGIGEGLSSVIHEFVTTGQSSMLLSLQAQTSPESVIAQVPVIGKTLARRVVDQLNISTLEELEQAAHDGRLDQVEGFGPKRVEAVRMGLAGILGGAAQRRSARVIPPAEQESAGRAPAEGSGDQDQTGQAKADRPGVDLLLEIDAEYHRKAEAGELKTIAPRRFNPKGEAWLPVMRTKQGGWDFTALYSNTARAHEMGANYDWVVIYYERGGGERQATVVTANSGPLQGRRVVRGREAECREYYESLASQTQMFPG
jgi:hypothetical protein